MIECASATQARPSADIHEEFLDAVCSDEEWLRAEFDAIVEAGWGSRDRPPPHPGSPTPPPQPPAAETVGDQSGSPADREPLIRRVARQRGPPLGAAHDWKRGRKGGDHRARALTEGGNPAPER